MGQKPSFVKNILGNFIEFDESEPTPGNTAVSEQSKATPDSSNSLSAKGSSAIMPNDLDKFQRHFEKLFETANLPGPDYYEFTKTMETLRAHIPDEKALMVASFKALTIQGITKDIILSSAAQYKQLIQSDKEQFLLLLASKLNENVHARKEELIDTEANITANNAKIQQLIAEVEKAKDKAQKLQREIAEEETKLNHRKEGYLIAREAIEKRIDADIIKIQTNL